MPISFDYIVFCRICRYKGKGTKWYKGTIARDNRDGTYDIRYDDGDTDRDAFARNIRSLGNAGGGDRFGATSSSMHDESLIPRYTRMSHTGHLDEHESKLPQRSDDAVDNHEVLSVGTKVEARYRGRARYYEGRVSRVNRNGTYDIDYVDGEKENFVEPALVRSLEPHHHNQHNNTNRRTHDPKLSAEFDTDPHKGPFHVGQRVAACVPVTARVLGVSADGASVDVQFHDDDRVERNVELSRVGSGGGGGAGSSSNHDRRDHGHDHLLRVGDPVEARFRGRSRFYPGKVARVHHNDDDEDNYGRRSSGGHRGGGEATYDIHYDDGEREERVARELINTQSDHRSGGGNRQAREEEEEEVRPGAIVDVRRWFPGKVERAPSSSSSSSVRNSRSSSDGLTYDVRLTGSTGLRPPVDVARGMGPEWVKGDPDFVHRAEVGFVFSKETDLFVIS
jgi:hypothetical protein